MDRNNIYIYIYMGKKLRSRNTSNVKYSRKHTKRKHTKRKYTKRKHTKRKYTRKYKVVGGSPPSITPLLRRELTTLSQEARDQLLPYIGGRSDCAEVVAAEERLKEKLEAVELDAKRCWSQAAEQQWQRLAEWEETYVEAEKRVKAAEAAGVEAAEEAEKRVEAAEAAEQQWQGVVVWQEKKLVEADQKLEEAEQKLQGALKHADEAQSQSSALMRAEIDANFEVPRHNP
jgi:hypothetical protein